MKKIYETGLNQDILNTLPDNASLDEKVGCYDYMTGYDELEPYEEFVYVSRIPTNECKAYKINNKFAVLVNYCNKYIPAKRYSNCLSIGDGDVIEYASLKQAAYAIEKGKHNDL